MIAPRRPDEVGPILRAHIPGSPPLAVRGRATRSAMPPPEVEVLSLEGLAGIESLDADEMVVTALAGTPLDTVARAAREADLILCPLLPEGLGGSLGGLFASGEESPAAPLEGGIRDAVLGVEGWTGDGSRLRSGGRVVKNVTGYDLTRFLSGSRGQLAVITRVHWRLRRYPERWLEVVARRAPEETLDLMVAIRDAAEPTAVRFELGRDEVRARLLVEGRAAIAAETATEIAAATGGDPPRELEPEELASWLTLGAGPVGTATARQWAETFAETAGERRDGRAVAFPCIGVGVGLPRHAVPGGAPSPLGPLASRVRAAWDPAGTLWDGAPPGNRRSV